MHDDACCANFLQESRDCKEIIPETDGSTFFSEWQCVVGRPAQNNKTRNSKIYNLGIIGY